MERLNFNAFYGALLKAKDMQFGTCSSGGNEKQGRSLSYTTKIKFNGNLMAGKAYAARLGLKPGDEFEIMLDRKLIRQVPAGGADEED
jgi:hypothetical protein